MNQLDAIQTELRTLRLRVEQLTQALAANDRTQLITLQVLARERFDGASPHDVLRLLEATGVNLDARRGRGKTIRITADEARRAVEHYRQHGFPPRAKPSATPNRNS